MCRFWKGQKSMKNVSGFCCTNQGKICNDKEIKEWKKSTGGN